MRHLHPLRLRRMRIRRGKGPGKDIQSLHCPRLLCQVPGAVQICQSVKRQPAAPAGRQFSSRFRQPSPGMTVLGAPRSTHPLTHEIHQTDSISSLRPTLGLSSTAWLGIQACDGMIQPLQHISLFSFSFSFWHGGSADRLGSFDTLDLGRHHMHEAEWVLGQSRPKHVLSHGLHPVTPQLTFFVDSFIH